MPHRLWIVLMFAAASAVSGCSSQGALSRYTYDSPQAAEQAGLYLDGTGPTAEAAERAETRRQAARQAPRPTAARPAPAEDLSARTTGSRAQAQATAEPLKPYSDEWWQKENREDARLKQKMNICRGC
jgi:hypothetical protein